jgi:CheY-like chemotaxis protein
MNILIADDDRATAQLLSSRLTKAGHRTTVAFDTTQAQMMCRRSQPDAVIIDVQMPGGTGLQVLHRLKTSPKTSALPVIILTSHPENEELALEKGADAFLLKPPDFERIDAVLERFASARTAPAPRHPKPSQQPFIVRNVLVVEDDRVVADFIGHRLKRSGFATIFAGDVPDALHLLNSFRIDAVVLDLDLPSGNGLDIIQRLKSFSRTGDIPIFVVSGSTDEHGAEFAVSAGADRFFSKPPDLDQLIDALRGYYPAPRPTAEVSPFAAVQQH